MYKIHLDEESLKKKKVKLEIYIYIYRYTNSKMLINDLQSEMKTHNDDYTDIVLKPNLF